MDNEKQFIYILHGVRAVKASDKQKDDGLKIFQLTMPHQEDATMERYRKFQKEFYNSNIDYHITEFVVAYFYDEDDAIDCAINNFGGYDEGGVYNYGLIEKLPIGRAYPSSSFSSQYTLYSYNVDLNCYELVENFSELEVEILKVFDSLYTIRD